jgi:hypothetical protein
MFALVLLTFAVLVILFRARVAAVRAGRLSLVYFRLYQGEEEPESTKKPARHLTNLFETPVLFYVACLAAMVTHVDGMTMQLLAWAYVAARCVHAFVHIRGNRLSKRMRAFFVSLLILLAMWIYLVIAVSASA